MFDTISSVEAVNDISRDLVTLFTTKPEGVDSVHQILLKLSPLETAALRLHHSALKMLTACQFVSL